MCVCVSDIWTSSKWCGMRMSQNWPNALTLWDLLFICTCLLSYHVIKECLLCTEQHAFFFFFFVYKTPDFICVPIEKINGRFVFRLTWTPRVLVRCLSWSRRNWASQMPTLTFYRSYSTASKCHVRTWTLPHKPFKTYISLHKHTPFM